MRMSAIQTDEQLVYVVRCLIAYADACGLFNSKPELQQKAEKFCDEYTAMLAAKKAAREQKATALVETERSEDQAAIIKVEEKKEEPSQRSQENIERDATVLRLEPLKKVEKQPQLLQSSDNNKQSPKMEQILSPSIVPIQQIIQPILPSLIAPIQQQEKQIQPIPTNPFALSEQPQQPQKQVQSIPMESVVPIQQPQKQLEPIPTISATSIQQPKKQIEPVLAVSAGTTKTSTQEPQKQIQSVPTSSAASTQQPQKQIQSVPTSSATPIQQSKKQIQLTPTVSVIPAQQQQQKQTAVIAKLKPAQNLGLKATQMPSSSTSPSKTPNYEPSCPKM
uniref:Uncharacterized protein n=1 Tax=Loa loa TaxID=7209 RepID=A0A1I7V8P1_LOALO